MSTAFRIGRYWLAKPPSKPYYLVRWRDGATLRSRSLGTDDLESAKVAMAEFVVSHGKPQDTQAMGATLGLVFSRYWTHHGSQQRSAETIRLNLDKWAQHFGAAFPVADLDAVSVSRFTRQLQAKHSAGYVQRIMTMGRAALNWAARHEGIPAPHIQVPRSTKRREIVLSPDALGALLDAALPHQYRYAVIAINTAARPGAILGLTWDRVGNGLIRLSAGEQTAKRQPVLPITRTLAGWLDVWPRDHERVISYKGQSVAKLRKFREWADRAGIWQPGIVPYTIRHTVATWLANSGLTADEVGKWLGHSATTTTARYIHTGPDYLRGCREAIDALFEQEGLRRHRAQRGRVVSIKP